MRKYFITGLLIVLPVLATVYLFVSLFAFFDGILGRYIDDFVSAQFGYKVHGLGILIFIFAIFVVGFLATNFIGRSLFRFFEKLWLRFPLVSKVYPAIKQITQFLFMPKFSEIQKVVLLEFPRKGIYALGFATNRCEKSVEENLGPRAFFNVLVPFVPSPFTGMLVFAAKEELFFLDISVEDALKLVVSGGVLNPKDFLKNRSAAD